jgi:hypothetical protein
MPRALLINVGLKISFQVILIFSLKLSEQGIETGKYYLHKCQGEKCLKRKSQRNSFITFRTFK